MKTKHKNVFTTVYSTILGIAGNKMWLSLIKVESSINQQLDFSKKET